MRVVVDGVAFENSRQRGVQRYCRELIDHLPAEISVHLLLGDKPRAALPAHGLATRLAKPPISLLSRQWRRRLTGPARRRHEQSADVFHASYFTLPLADVPAVVSVQDMIVERFVDYFQNEWAQGEVTRKRKAIMSATLLLTGSHAAAAELAAFYPAVADRIVVTPYGADHLAGGPNRHERSGTSDGYALFVGERALYKNFRAILEAMGSPLWPHGLGLRVVGPEPHENELLLAQRMAGPDAVQFVGRVDDAALAGLYANASVTIAPSLEEGFGFPVLEAQRAGSLVACSNIPVFRETAADSALFFDPTRPAELAAAVARACEPAEALALRAAGRENVGRFTWTRCAELTVEAYARAIEWHKDKRPRPASAIPGNRSPARERRAG